MDDVFADKLILEKNRIHIADMSMEELIPLMICSYIFGDVFLNEEIEDAEQSTEKMKLVLESSASICIDTSKMEYVEENNDAV